MTAFVIFRLPTMILLVNEDVGMLLSLFFVTGTDSALLAVNEIPFAICSCVRFSVTVYVPVGRPVILAFPSTSVPSPSTAVMLPFVIVMEIFFVVTGMTPSSLDTVKLYVPSARFVLALGSPLTVTVFPMFRLPVSRSYVFVKSIWPLDTSAPVS